MAYNLLSWDSSNYFSHFLDMIINGIMKKNIIKMTKTILKILNFIFVRLFTNNLLCIMKSIQFKCFMFFKIKGRIIHSEARF